MVHLYERDCSVQRRNQKVIEVAPSVGMADDLRQRICDAAVKLCQHALKDINLEIEEGQVVVLLGPSGSGKSTLIRTINALEGIESGELIVNGHHECFRSSEYS